MSEPVSEPGVPADPVFQFDSLFRPEFMRAPQPYFKHMRETNPVLRTPSMHMDGSTTVYVARHDDVDFVLHNPGVFSSKFGRGGGLEFPLIPINIDPPDHLKYRRLLDPYFGPRQMSKLEDEISRRANERIDEFIERKACDYAAEYAVPLPCEVFVRLMGIPVDETDVFLRWKDEVLHGSGQQLMSGEDPVRQRAWLAVTERFESLIDERQKAPRDDLLSYLVQGRVDGEPLTPEEVLGICHLLLIAGLDTVTDSLTCFYAFLGRNAGHRRRIVEEPGVIPTAVEEMMRFESPVPFLPRVCAEQTQLGGCPIGAGESVVVLLGSANTDERAYDRPDVVDFDRAAIRHFAFGSGPHRCLGSHLARLELQVSLREWHRRIPDYHVPDDVELKFGAINRRVECLPLVLDID